MYNLYSGESLSIQTP